MTPPPACPSLARERWSVRRSGSRLRRGPGRTIAGAVASLSLLCGGGVVQAQQNAGEVLWHREYGNADGGLGIALAAGDRLGEALAPLGDLDGDGRLDLALGAPGYENRGAVWIAHLGPGGGVASMVRVDDAEASLGLTGTDTFGTSLAALGDLDGDGVTELAVGSPDSQGARGVVWVLFLAADGSVRSSQRLEPGQAGLLPRLAAGESFGSALAGLGDLDGDGVPDLAVGANRALRGVGDEGSTWVLFLRADGSVKGTSEIGANTGGFAGPLPAGARFGSALASLGDLDGAGPGACTLAVGADGASSAGTGAVWLLNLDAAGTVLDQRSYVSPDVDGDDGFGGALSPVLDLDGNGVVDLAVGASGYRGGRGAVWTLRLDASGAVLGERRIGEGSGGFRGLLDGAFGAALASLGDLDGDGRADLAVGEPECDDGGAATGALWSLFLDDGSATGSPGEVLWQRKLSNDEGGLGQGLGLPADERFGASVASLGDLNGDGVGDLVVGAAQSGQTGGTGALWILFLRRDGSVLATNRIDASSPGLALRAGDAFGASVTTLGDLDGDGVVDLAVGAPKTDGFREEEGAVWILFLQPSGRLKATQRIGLGTGGFRGILFEEDAFGSAVSGMGDLNGDGTVDLAVGAELSQRSLGEEGSVWILLMNPDGTVKREREITNGKNGFEGFLEPRSRFGSSIATLGDPDGAGPMALALAVGADARQGLAEGAVWLLFLDDNGSVVEETRIDASAVAPDLDADDAFGSALACVGDLNRDGSLDVAVGARHYEPPTGQGREGGLWVLFLSPGGELLGRTGVTRGTGNFAGAPEAGFGAAIAFLGDFDRDGRADLAVGEPDSSVGASRSGAVWGLFLSDGSVRGTSSTTWTGQQDDDWNVAANWTNGVPGPDSTAVLPGSSLVVPRIKAGGAPEVIGDLLMLPSAGLDLARDLEVRFGATVGDAITSANASTLRAVGTQSPVVVGGGGSLPNLALTSAAACRLQGGPLTVSSAFDVTTSLEVDAGARLVSTGTSDLGAGVLSGTGVLDLDGPAVLTMTSTSSPDLEVSGSFAVDSLLYRPGFGVLNADGRLTFDGTGPLDVVQLGAVAQAELQHVDVRPGADVRFGTPLLCHGDLVVDGILYTQGDVEVHGDFSGSGGLAGGGSCTTGTFGRNVSFGGTLSVCRIRFEPPVPVPLVGIELPQGLPGDVEIHHGGQVTFQGAPMTVAGDLLIGSGDVLAATSLQVLGNLDLQGGSLTAGKASTITVAGEVLVQSGASLDAGTGTLALGGSEPVAVRGLLAAGIGGAIELGMRSVSFESGSWLQLIGSATDPACVVGGSMGGRYGFDVQSGASVAAQNFHFEEMGVGGISIATGVTLAPAPLDFRSGVFDKVAPGGVLLAIGQGTSVDLRYLTFENTDANGMPVPPPPGSYNVRVAPGSSLVSLTNWNGSFAGPAFDDPSNPPVWSAAEVTLLGAFAVEPPTTRITLEWTTTLEVDVEAFVLERAVSPGGSFEVALEVPSQGAGTYRVDDLGARARTAYDYRLSERLTHGALRELGTASTSGVPVWLQWQANGIAGGGTEPGPPLGPWALDDGSENPRRGTDARARGPFLHTLGAGFHAAFRVEEPAGDVLVVGESGGRTRVDVRATPLVVRGVAAGTSVVLSNLWLEAGAGPALVVEDCAGSVLLDRLVVRGGPETTAVLVHGAPRLALQHAELSAGLGLRLEGGARTLAFESELGALHLSAGARLWSHGGSGHVAAQQASRWERLPRPATAPGSWFAAERLHVQPDRGWLLEPVTAWPWGRGSAVEPATLARPASQGAIVLFLQGFSPEVAGAVGVRPGPVDLLVLGG